MGSDEVAILFSGGVDSTAAAVYFLKRGCRAHLLTFDNGAEKWLELSEYKAGWIARQFPGRCTWRLLDSTHLFHELAIKGLEEDVRRYGNLVCCGCKLAMLTEAMLHCRRNGIGRIADGFKREQDFYPEQTPDYMVPADAFARRFGFSCEHPFYEFPDLVPGHLTLGGAVPTTPVQPYCLFGNNPVLDKRSIRPYVESRIPLMERYFERAIDMEPAAGGVEAT
ncbi:MAG: 7-cyano-7-deazaguanine synthase [bacterium]|nr:7-cyano-7-deazaguanine synthase [bacterium]